MRPEEKYKYWAMLADYDLDTAKVLMAGERWAYVAYVCQQALERQLKGMYVYYVGKEAPKSHNLPFLFEAVKNSSGFPQCRDPEVFTAERSDDCEDFLTEVMFYYMSDYPFSYKRIVSRFIGADLGRELFAKTCKTVAWLRILQPPPEPVDPESLTRQT
jgi:HEPN domain-containing protein